MYSNLRSAICVENGITESFKCSIGTRQGCMLSPFIFSLYMNELIDMLYSFDCRGTYINAEAKNIITLMYADDVAECASTVKRLQDMINVLSEFCKKWGLEINLAKTEVMVFRRGGCVKEVEKWVLDNKEIHTTKCYKYLGLMLTSVLNWSKAVYVLCSQASRALCMITKYSIKCGGLPPGIAFELFDKTIVPIALYGAEIWGYKQYSAIENLQIRFCKNILGLPAHASNNAALGECGRLPLAVLYFKKCIKYWLKILRMPNTRYVKCCYLMLKRLDEHGKITWATSVKNLLFKYGFGTVWVEQEVANQTAFIIEFTTRLKDCFSQDWYREVHDSSKLSVYCTFKSLLEPEKYLTMLNWKFRKVLSRFRCSSHNLEVERGRHDGVLMENRICRFCEARNTTVMEDELHFLLYCPKYYVLRLRYLPMRYVNEPSFTSFISLMSSDEPEIIRNVAKFIFYAEKIREKL